jgi:AbrB family looped-hinge helix DNA binding protein
MNPERRLLAKARMASKGQITLPKEIRDRLQVGPGDEVEFVEDEHGMWLRKVVTNEAAEGAEA